MRDGPGPPPPDVDHLVFGARELEEGVERIEELLGARAAAGGRHPRFGTHNALLSLGATTYLEVIAPDPGLDIPDRGLPFGLDALAGPRLVAWAVRTPSIDAVAGRAAATGVTLGAVEAGSRERPGGAVLSWRLTDPRALPLGGAVPFLIDWGDTPHPAASAPSGGVLRGLLVEHPRPDRVGEALSALGVAADVRRADAVGLVATVEARSGTVELR